MWEEVLLATLFALAFFTFRGLYGVVAFSVARRVREVATGLSPVMLRGLVRTLASGRRNDAQERRRARNLNDEIYDVTGWSLPLMFNLDMDACNRVPKVDTAAVSLTDKLQGEVSTANAKVAFLVPWGDMAAGRFLTAALRQGIKLKSFQSLRKVNGLTLYLVGNLYRFRKESSLLKSGK